MLVAENHFFQPIILDHDIMIKTFASVKARKNVDNRMLSYKLYYILMYNEN